MVKRILIFGLIFSFLIPHPALVFAQQFELDTIAEELRLTPKEKISPEEEAYRTFTCPTCLRHFEVKVDPNDVELKKGIKKISCPYDGTEFYPQTSGREEALQYETIRCPSCGREFKGYVDVRALLAGQSQLLTCPYDKKKFYFKAEGFKHPVLQWANMRTVMCPSDKRTFKAYVDLENPKEITCPYDGTKFFPTPELIEPAQGMMMPTMSASTSGVLGGVTAESALGSGSISMAQPLMSAPTPPAGQPLMPVAEKPSRIEEMFSEHLPLGISRALKQFGYDVFKPVERVSAREQERGKEDAQGRREEGGLLQALLGRRQEGGVWSGTAEIGGPSLFMAPTEVPSISDYVLGPGDTIRILIWGQVQETSLLTIDSEGKVLLPKTGPVYLWGLKFSEAEKLIKDNLLKVYTNIDVSVSLSKLRGIKVFVLGEAQRPGAYTISSLSNSFHALYAAGGPTKLGSMRNMKLVRKNSPEAPIDLYNILLKGDNSQDHKLQGNDTIFIPLIGDTVGVAGNVKRPAIYELKDKTKLSDIIEMAGGVSSVGYLQRIQLERVDNHIRKVVLDLDFRSFSDMKSSQNNLDVQDGDLVLVFPISPIRHNFVSIAGNVLRPGDYELKAGMRLKDLLDKAGGILPGTYLKRAEVSRFKGDQTREILVVSLTDLIDGKEEANIILKEWDIVTTYSKRDAMPNLFVAVEGAVNKPGVYELLDNMKISDLVFRAGGLKTNASMTNCELFRGVYDKGTRIFNVDLNKVFSADSELARKNDLILEEDDHLFIREDISKGAKQVITLSGEFWHPGKYAVEKGARLSEVIKMAGGFREGMFLDGCVYTRESVRIAQRKMIKGFLDSEEKALLQEQSSLAVGLTPVQAASRNKLIEYRQRLIERLGNMEVPGRILIRLSEDMSRFESSEYDIVVEDGDSLHIPAHPSTVQIVGNVYGPGTVVFSKDKGIDYYINKVGGLTKYADINRTFIIRANGETISRFARAVKIKRGDTIVVPEEFKYRTLPGLVLKDIVQVVYQAILGAAVTVTAVNAL